MSYLITCTGSKRVPDFVNASTLDQLSFNEELLEFRQHMLNTSRIQLNWNFTLPAWQLYSGTRSKLYPRVSNANWNKPCVDIKILSALFGWLKHTDLIPYYNLKMTDRIGIDNQAVWNIWRQIYPLDVLIDPTDIDLLSNSYRRAINGNILPVATVPDVQFNDYGTQKGDWLNAQLNLVDC